MNGSPMQHNLKTFGGHDLNLLAAYVYLLDRRLNSAKGPAGIGRQSNVPGLPKPIPGKHLIPMKDLFSVDTCHRPQIWAPEQI